MDIIYSNNIYENKLAKTDISSGGQFDFNYTHCCLHHVVMWPFSDICTRNICVHTCEYAISVKDYFHVIVAAQWLLLLPKPIKLWTV